MAAMRVATWWHCSLVVGGDGGSGCGGADGAGESWLLRSPSVESSIMTIRSLVLKRLLLCRCPRVQAPPPPVPLAGAAGGSQKGRVRAIDYSEFEE